MWLLFAIYLIVIITKGLVHNKLVLKRYENITEQLVQEKKLNTELKLRIKELNTDSFVELLARKKLGLVMPGEVVYKIIK